MSSKPVDLQVHSQTAAGSFPITLVAIFKSIHYSFGTTPLDSIQPSNSIVILAVFLGGLLFPAGRLNGRLSPHMQASSARLFCSSACKAAAHAAQKRQQKQLVDEAGIHLLKAVSTRKSQKQRAKDGSDVIASAVYNQPNEDASTYLSPFFRPSFDLAQFHQILDIHPQAYSNPSPHLQTVHINTKQSRLFPTPSAAEIARIEAQGVQEDLGEDVDPLQQLAQDQSLNMSIPMLRSLHRYALAVRRVVNMTSKGKQPSMAVLVVVGDGKGLLGYGEGKAENITQASDKAFVQAVKNMDYVQRKDDRTIWSDYMKAKWGATIVELRSRPPGKLI